MRMIVAVAASASLAWPAVTRGDDGIRQFLAGRAARDAAVAHSIWEWAEVGYQEVKSSALLQQELVAGGFRVDAGVAGIPTAFVASWGQAGPVIGILAEFDALPGITQGAEPVRAPLAGRLSGHACGHHLFGTASVAAAIALRDWLQRSGTPGTIRVYGTPAEEGGAGKVYMVRAGLFRDVDAVLHWHPADVNSAGLDPSLANKSAKFRFHGLSAHASASPERGRSALDGIEAMNHMVNLMREHVPADARIHYVITSGGSAPNVVPDFAESYFYVRHADTRMVEEIFDRIVKAAEGAALGTGTRMDYEIIGGVHSLLPNETLARVIHAKLVEVSGVEYTAAEQAFAEKIHASLIAPTLPLGSEREVQAFDFRRPGIGSTDVADISWNVPTAGLRTAAWVPGTPAHSWQAIAAGGMSIGTKGMHNASRTLALAGAELYSHPELVERARTEFEARRGPDFHYRPVLGDREPPLDYRRGAAGGE